MTRIQVAMAQISELSIELGRDLTEEESDDIWLENGVCPQCGQGVGHDEYCETCREYAQETADMLRENIEEEKMWR